MFAPLPNDKIYFAVHVNTSKMDSLEELLCIQRIQKTIGSGLMPHVHFFIVPSDKNSVECVYPNFVVADGSLEEKMAESIDKLNKLLEKELNVK